MIARLIKDSNSNIKLLCKDGSISIPTLTILGNLLTNFKNAKYFTGDDGKWSEQYKDMSTYPGENLAYVTDDACLFVIDADVFAPILSETYRMGSYLSVTEYAKKFNKSREIIKVLCREGRIVGAQKIGNQWMIPKDAPYPVPPHRRRNASPSSVEESAE